MNPSPKNFEFVPFPKDLEYTGLVVLLGQPLSSLRAALADVEKRGAGWPVIVDFAKEYGETGRRFQVYAYPNQKPERICFARIGRDDPIREMGDVVLQRLKKREKMDKKAI